MRYLKKWGSLCFNNIHTIDIKKKRYQFIKIDKNLPVKHVEKIKEFGYKDGYHITLNKDNYKNFI